MILIDAGSSSVKVYEYNDKKLKLISTHSLHLKTKFPEARIKFIELIKSLQQKYPSQDIQVYGTAVFRKLTNDDRELFIKELHTETGITINIISAEQENAYLREALIHKYTGADPVLLINIGGGSTELVVLQNREQLETQNIDLGVMPILAKFPNINESIAGCTLTEVMAFTGSFLQKISTRPKIAFYSGGELNYMRLADYNLTPNTIFSDSDHPSMISLDNFAQKNEDIFSKIPLSKLEALMPNDPKWMLGARPCSAFAQSICQKYGIKTIIPSDANLINGVVASLN